VGLHDAAMLPTETPPKITSFLGLNNVTDPLRAGLGWLSTADNVVVTDTGALEKREGYSRVESGSFSAAYSTMDYRRAYLVASGTLRTLSGASVRTGIGSAPMYWAEINDDVYFNNGTDRGIIRPDNSLIDWGWDIPVTPALSAVTGTLPPGQYQVQCTQLLADGRETGASDSVEIVLIEGQALQIIGLAANSRVYIAPADSTVYQYAGTYTDSFVWNSSPDNLGRELLNDALDPLPLGTDVIQFWKGRAYAAQYMPEHAQTVVWFSEPMGFHLFNLSSSFFMVPGKVTMLAPHDSALVVGTDTRQFAYTGDGLKEIADYGVIPGQHWAKDDDRILYWTTRGVCTFPFSNLTERSVSVAPGIKAGGTIVRQGGQKRYLVALQQGGSAFNSF